MTLYIYKAYFKSHHICIKWPYIENTCKQWPSALVSLKEVIASFAPQDFVTKYLLIFIVDEVKNFAANDLPHVGELVTYWESCID